MTIESLLKLIALAGTQKKLADLLDRDTETIRKWKKGSHIPKKAEDRMLHIFGLTADELEKLSIQRISNSDSPS